MSVDHARPLQRLAERDPDQVARASGAGLATAVASAACFGSSGTFATSLLRAGWSPAAAVTLRIAVAAAVLSAPALSALRGRAGWWHREARHLAGYGLVAVAGCQLCYFEAVSHLSVAVALLLEYSGTLLVVVWMWARHRQRPGALTAAGAVASVAGLALVLDLGGAERVDLPGVLWGLGAAVGLAVYFILSAGQPSRSGSSLPPIAVAWGGMVVGAAGMGLAGATGAVPMHATFGDVSLAGHRVDWLVPVFGLSVVAAAVAYVSGIAAARMLGARLSSFVGLAEVLCAAVYAWLLLGEALSALQLVGGALVLAGIALVRAAEGRTARGLAVAPPDPGLADERAAA